MDLKPISARPIWNGNRMLYEGTLLGLLMGATMGSIKSYLKSPVIVGGKIAPNIMREVIQDVGGTSLWVGGVAFGYVAAKEVAMMVRPVRDEKTSFFGGFVAGLIYAARRPTIGSVAGYSMMFGFTAYLTEGPVRYFSEAGRNALIRQKYNEEIKQRYWKEVQRTKAENDKRLIELNEEAFKQV